MHVKSDRTGAFAETSKDKIGDNMVLSNPFIQTEPYQDHSANRLGSEDEHEDWMVVVSSRPTRGPVLSRSVFL